MGRRVPDVEIVHPSLPGQKCFVREASLATWLANGWLLAEPDPPQKRAYNRKPVDDAAPAPGTEE